MVACYSLGWGSSHLRYPHAHLIMRIAPSGAITGLSTDEQESFSYKESL